MMNKQLTIEDFYTVNYIPWVELSNKLGERRYNKFLMWLVGQTTMLGGVYPEDLERFLKDYQ